MPPPRLYERPRVGLSSSAQFVFFIHEVEYHRQPMLSIRVRQVIGFCRFDERPGIRTA
jgi:hypothetical protein